MLIRSLLFVPGDSARKFDKASRGEADALILDLEDSVVPSQKAAARAITAGLLGQVREPGMRPQLRFVRVNALDSGLTLADLAAVMPARPDGIVLPKCSGPDDLRRLAHYLDAFEAAHGIQAGSTRLLPIVTETAEALFSLGQYSGCTPRLWGMMWGAEDLAAAIGAFGNRADGAYHEPFRLARNLCLAGARAAGALPIDTVHVDIADLDGLAAEARQARRDGFMGKAVIHPSHVAIVNAAFVPDASETDWATRVLAAAAAQPTAGVFTMDGQMIDKPHLDKARNILSLAGRA